MWCLYTYREHDAIFPERSASNYYCDPADDAPYLGDISIKMAISHERGIDQSLSLPFARFRVFPKIPILVSVNMSMGMTSWFPFRVSCTIAQLPSKAFRGREPREEPSLRASRTSTPDQPPAHQPSAHRHPPALRSLSASHRHEIRGCDLSSD